MRRFARAFVVTAAVLAAVLTAPIGAAGTPQRFIVRAAAGVLDGAAAITQACVLLGCRVNYGLDGSLGRLFLVTTTRVVSADAYVTSLRSLSWLVGDAEVDQTVRTQGETAANPPPALLDSEPVSFYGGSVRGGYLRQPAADILGLAAARQQFGVTGRGITVAVIDTGVDPSHPALANVLLAGYDYTRDRAGASERGDISQSTVAVVDGVSPAWVNQSTVAVVDQSTVAVVDDGAHQGFGHGTMVAGVVHLTAPEASILPLKAFNADGSGYASDVLRAVYAAVKANAKVINMSFSFSTSSMELQRALDYAASRGVVSVASVGNNADRVLMYPAALATVIGVASTNDADTLSLFSNYGPDTAWIAAPGEAIVTTYPFGTYAAAWGTSFSAPFAAGAAALLAQTATGLTSADAHDAEGHAKWISYEVSRGRLDVAAAIQAWRTKRGLR